VAQPTRYQYVKIVGPVLVPPPPFDPTSLSWLPSGRQPTRALLPHRLTDTHVSPVFNALYKPEGLQWQPSDRYAGRLLSRSPKGTTVVVLEVYDPQSLDWVPRGQQTARTLTPHRLVDTHVYPPLDSLYKPEGLEWIPSDKYVGKPLDPHKLGAYVIDPFPITAAPFDPATLAWLPLAEYRQRRLERAPRPYSIVVLEIYDPQSLDWTPSVQQPARGLPPHLLIPVVADPVPIAAPFDPATLEWLPSAEYRQRQLSRAGRATLVVVLDVYDPQTLEWIGSSVVAARPVERRGQIIYVVDPTTPAPAVFDPSTFPWIVDSARNRLVRGAGQTFWVIDATALIPPSAPPEDGIYIPTIRRRRR